jgi:hypothetical protein
MTKRNCTSALSRVRIFFLGFELAQRHPAGVSEHLNRTQSFGQHHWAVNSHQMQLRYSTRTATIPASPQKYERGERRRQPSQHGALTWPGVTGPKTSILPGWRGGPDPAELDGGRPGSETERGAYWDSGSGVGRSGKVVYMWGLKRAGAGPRPQQEEGGDEGIWSKRKRWAVAVRGVRKGGRRGGGVTQGWLELRPLCCDHWPRPGNCWRVLIASASAPARVVVASCSWEELLFFERGFGWSFFYIIIGGVWRCVGSWVAITFW